MRYSERLLAGAFNPLSPIKDFEIRLLEFGPECVFESKQPKLFATLITVALEDAAPYIAISYKWDDEGVPKAMSVGGEECEVSQDLFEALLRVGRKMTDPKQRSFARALLWIDSICINQEDKEEKESQVARMGQVYGSADIVWIWLGMPGKTNMKNVQAICGKISPAVKDVQMQNFAFANPTGVNVSWDQGTNEGRLLRRFDPHELNRREWVDFAMFLERPWFSRIWIVQETALARKIEANCGDHQLHWGALSRCAVMLNMGLDTQLGHIYSRARTSETEPASVGAGLIGLMGCCALIKNEANKKWVPKPFVAYHTGQKDIVSNEAALCVLLAFCQNRKASDWRDLVWALYSLIPCTVQGPQDVNTLPSIDFSRSRDMGERGRQAATLYHQVARSIIMQTRWLGFLTMVEHCAVESAQIQSLNDSQSILLQGSPEQSVRKISGLPSWVPDLTAAKSEVVGMDGSFDKHMAYIRGAKTGGEKGSIVEGRILHCSGHLLGKVASSSVELDIFCFGDDTFESGAQIILQCPNSYPFTKERKDDVGWRCLLGQSDLPPSLRKSFGQFWLRRLVQKAKSSNMPLKEFLATIPSVLKLGNASKDKVFPTREKIEALLETGDFDKKSGRLQGEIMLESGAFETLFRKVCTGRKFFRSDKNHLGISHASLRTGDELWFLAHAPTPFILRRTGETENEYRLVGHTYVHGFPEGILPDLQPPLSRVSII